MSLHTTSNSVACTSVEVNIPKQLTRQHNQNLKIWMFLKYQSHKQWYPSHSHERVFETLPLTNSSTCTFHHQSVESPVEPWMHPANTYIHLQSMNNYYLKTATFKEIFFVTKIKRNDVSDMQNCINIVTESKWSMVVSLSVDNL